MWVSEWVDVGLQSHVQHIQIQKTYFQASYLSFILPFSQHSAARMWSAIAGLVSELEVPLGVRFLCFACRCQRVSMCVPPSADLSVSIP